MSVTYVLQVKGKPNLVKKQQLKSINHYTYDDKLSF